MSHCQCEENENGGSFVFGLILGLIVGAIVAIVIYKKSKGKILDQLKEKFESFLNPPTFEKPAKVDVIIPKDIVPPTPVVVKKPKKLFLKRKI